MNYTLNSALIFAAGAAIGSLVTWQLLRHHYENIVQKESMELREFYRSKMEASEQQTEEKPSKEDVEEYVEKIQDYTTEKGAEIMRKNPYVIAPDEYGDNDEYETISLTYYADGVLADDMDDIIDDVDDRVGEDFADHFGEYEDDAVFIRNDETRCDYEILRDERRYEDVSTNMIPPHLQVED